MNSQNFYLHIPFCRQKCPYCKFALTPIFDDIKKRRYLEYLKKEIREYFILSSLRSEDLLENGRDSHPNGTSKPHFVSQGAPSENDKKIKTIYFWGGTPSILTTNEVGEILECFPWFDSLNPEMTFECNPEDITEEYVRWILDLGINRISLGVQSLNNETLQAIHRSDRESIFQALDRISSVIARKNDETIHVWENWNSGSLHASRWQEISLNVDFILWLPFSKPGETLRNIRELHERFPFITHTSVYMLEEWMYPKDWKKNSINEIEIEQEYTAICQHFESLWWNHYEISNWAKPGYESVHNRGYWNHTNYRGLGLSATSYEDGERWENSASFLHYYRWENISSEILTPEQIQLEKIIFGIRTFSLDARIFPREIVEELTQEWVIKIEDEKIILTPAWIFRENTIIAKLIEYIE